MLRLLLCLLLSQAVLEGIEQLCVRDVVVPAYERLARTAQLQGSVTVEIQVGPDGKIVSAKGRGAHPLLIRETERNIREWTFGPFPKDTKFPVRHTVVYVYKLEGAERYDDPPPKVMLHLPDRVEITTNPAQMQPHVNR
jgi:hypothetical protein